MDTLLFEKKVTRKRRLIEQTEQFIPEEINIRNRINIKMQFLWVSLEVYNRILLSCNRNNLIEDIIWIKYSENVFRN